jgi:hypothetical protein
MEARGGSGASMWRREVGASERAALPRSKAEKAVLDGAPFGKSRVRYGARRENGISQVRLTLLFAIDR